MSDGNEGILLKAEAMAQLTVRNVSAEVIDALRRRAKANGRAAEAEHRELLREALLGRDADFDVRAKALRRRLRSSVDSTDIIRADRDGVSVLAAPCRSAKRTGGLP